MVVPGDLAKAVHVVPPRAVEVDGDILVSEEIAAAQFGPAEDREGGRGGDGVYHVH